MAEKIPKLERLLNLTLLLLAARAPVPFSDVAGRVIGYDDGADPETLQKRFDRDKTELRALGIDVEYVAGAGGEGGGYVLRRDRIFQRKVVLRSEEAVLLSIAGRAGAAATGGGALHDALKSALRKLAVDLPADDPCAAGVPLTTVRVGAGDPESEAALLALLDAVAHGRRVRFSYRGGSDGAPRVRRVSPYGAGMFRGAWYLTGYCHDRGAIRAFKLARFEGEVGDDEGGPKPEDVAPAGFRTVDHLPRDAWDAGDGRPVAVRLKLRPGAPRPPFAAAAHIEPHDDGGAVVSLTLRRPEAIVPWIVSTAGDVAVLEPEALRRAAAASAAKIAAAHGEGGK